MKKGRRYGTILVDLERRAVVDLLPDRTSDMLKKWLKAHPGVEIITRDRSGSYSEGAKQGAPNAIQIADRFHLLVNLSDALKHIVQQNPGILKLSQETDVSSTSENAPKEPSPVVKQPEAPAVSASLGQKQELYRQVQELHQQGVSLRGIAESLGVTVNTAMNYVRLPEPPTKQVRTTRKTIGFEQYIGKRWDEGTRGSKQLFRELRSIGYRGSYHMNWRKAFKKWSESSLQANSITGYPKLNNALQAVCATLPSA